jgi:hypothetical protein
MGLDWSGQQQKLREQGEKFNCRVISMVASDGKLREMLCIPLEKLNGWLFSVNPEKVRPDIKHTVALYQEECFIVLYEYWHHGEAINPRFYEENATSLLISNLRERLALIEMKRRLSLSLQRVPYFEQISLKRSLNEICERLGENPPYSIGE